MHSKLLKWYDVLKFRKNRVYKCFRKFGMRSHVFPLYYLFHLFLLFFFICLLVTHNHHPIIMPQIRTYGRTCSPILVKQLFNCCSARMLVEWRSNPICSPTPHHIIGARISFKEYRSWVSPVYFNHDLDGALMDRPA